MIPPKRFRPKCFLPQRNWQRKCLPRRPWIALFDFQETTPNKKKKEHHSPFVRPQSDFELTLRGPSRRPGPSFRSIHQLMAPPSRASKDLTFCFLALFARFCPPSGAPRRAFLRPEGLESRRQKTSRDGTSKDDQKIQSNNTAPLNSPTSVHKCLD